MSIQLRVILIITSVCMCVYVTRKLKKSQLQVSDALFWIVLSFVLIFLSAFPQVVYLLTDFFEVQSAVNFVYLVMIFLLMVRCFLLSIKVSTLEDKVRKLVEEIAIRENRRDKR